MRQEVARRVLAEAAYILERRATVRACAKQFRMGKSTIHTDMRKRLPELDAAMARRVDEVLGRNLRERHIRGGAATRRKYRDANGRAQDHSLIPQNRQ